MELIGSSVSCGRRTCNRTVFLMSRHQLLGSSDNCRIVAEAGKPVDEGLLAEPGELAFGVAASGLDDGFRGGCEGNCAFEMRMQLAVPDEVERL